MAIAYFDNYPDKTLEIKLPNVIQKETYPIIRITKQKTGKKVKQKIIGNYAGKLQYIDVNTYKVLVTDKGDSNFKMEFSVVRDAYAVIPINDKGSTMILSNISFEPKDGNINHYSGKYMFSYPKKNDTPAIKLTQKGSEQMHAQARPKAVSLEYRFKEDIARGIMIHVGGSYNNEQYGQSIAASEGCFGIVNDLNSPTNTSDKFTQDIVNKIWKQAQKSKSNPNHIRIIIEKRDEKSIPTNITFTKK